MFCPKCGDELREGASYCDKCGYKLSSKAVPDKRPFLMVIILCLVIIILLLIIFITNNLKSEDKKTETNASASTKTELVDNTFSDNLNLNTETNENDKKSVFEENESDPVSNTESGFEEDNLFLNAKEELALPSLESFSKGRMKLESYEYSDLYGCYVATFNAGNDISVINCIAEYKDCLGKFDFNAITTLSNNDGTYNYTAYTFSYDGDSAIEKNSVNFDNSGDCTICFVTASGDGVAFINAYIPEGVIFKETSDVMKNSY